MRILCDNHCDNTGCFFGPRTFKVKALPKDKFPGQLKSVLDIVKSENLVSGSRKCGIYLIENFSETKIKIALSQNFK